MQLWLEVVRDDPGATREQPGSKLGAIWEHPEADRQQKSSKYKKTCFFDVSLGATREQPGSNPGATREQPGSNPGATREHPGTPWKQK